MKEIEKIITTYQNIDWTTEKIALGTLVKVEGSAYRRIGARILVKNNGQWVGGISGGCLEGDALKQAQKAMLKNKPSIVVYDTMEDDPHQIGVGLGCNGRIEVLFTPIHGNDKQNQIEFLKTITNKRSSTILLQVINITGGNNNLQGQFFTKDNYPELSKAIQIPLAALKNKIAATQHRRKSNTFIATNKLGHQYEILAEIISPKIKLICVGDNYDVHAMMELAMVLGWEIQVVGNLRKFSKAIHLAAHKVHSKEKVKDLEMEIDDYTAVVLMSHDYKTDLRFLKHLINKEIPYLGLLGPKKRTQKMQGALAEEGFEMEKNNLSFIHSPVGLDIGAESPEEIALSITAEIIARFRLREGGYLKYRADTIHERD